MFLLPVVIGLFSFFLRRFVVVRAAASPIFPRCRTTFTLRMAAPSAQARVRLRQRWPPSIDEFFNHYDIALLKKQNVHRVGTIFTMLEQTVSIVSSIILFVTLILFSLHPTSRLRPACSVDGTSAAAPTVAGLVALINAHRAKRGRPALGFANPLLYQAWTCVRVCAWGWGTGGCERVSV